MPPFLPGLRQTYAYYLSHPLRMLRTVGKLVFAGHLFFTYLYRWNTVSGPSMLPHFEIWGEGVVTSAQHRRGKGLAIGDVVSYKVPVSDDSYAVKRVLGLPGDYVLVESPDADRGRAGRMIQVPKGHCWVVGDNMVASRDSRLFGPLPMALITGKVIYKTGPWPFPWQWHRITNPFMDGSLFEKESLEEEGHESSSA